MAQPTIIFIPGAWTSLQVYQPYLSALQSEGYPTLILGYPSLGARNPFSADVARDTAALIPALTTLVNGGKEIVLVMHGYAGMPGAAAAKGLSIERRRFDGREGGIIGLFMIAAFVVPEGSTCAEAQGGMLPPWVLQNQPKPGLNVPNNLRKMFTAGLHDNLAAALEKSLLPHSTFAFTSPQPAPAFEDDEFDGKLAYQMTTDDMAVPKSTQRVMVNATGKGWIIKELKGSHFAPFDKKFLRESVRQLGDAIRIFKERRGVRGFIPVLTLEC